jgi:hypothetical protein
MDRVVIVMDPHKASVTIEARDALEVLRVSARFGTDNRQYQAMLRVAGPWPQRLWAGEGANGIVRPVTQRLLADGISEKLSADPHLLCAEPGHITIGNRDNVARQESA